MMKFGVVDNGLLIIMMMAGVNREYAFFAVALCKSLLVQNPFTSAVTNL